MQPYDVAVELDLVRYAPGAEVESVITVEVRAEMSPGFVEGIWVHQPIGPQMELTDREWDVALQLVAEAAVES